LFWLGVSCQASAQARPTPQATAQTTESAPLSATPTADANAQAYSAAVDLGFKEFELGNYAEAQEHFLKAASLDRNARVLRALGMTSYELRNYADCIAYLSEALPSTHRPLSAADRADAEVLLGRARGYVARYTLVTRPERVELQLDDAPLALDASRSALLRVGPHHLEASAPSYRPSRRELLVVGGEDKTLQIDLEPMASARALSDESSSAWSSPWLWIGVGAAVVGAGVALAFVMQPDKKSVIDDPVTTSQSPGVVIRALSKP
jgi:tetratricopeptide (TPR) repeat protein